jgi:hypothetical protein
VAGLVPVTSIVRRSDAGDRRDKPGDDTLLCAADSKQPKIAVARLCRQAGGVFCTFVKLHVLRTDFCKVYLQI